MNNEELTKLNEGRTLRLAFPALLGVYKAKHKSAVTRLVAAYKVGEKLEPIAAEISVYQNLIDELYRRSKETENLERKVHKT